METDAKKLAEFVNNHVHVDLSMWTFIKIVDPEKLSYDYDASKLKVIDWDSIFCDVCNNEIEFGESDDETYKNIMKHAKKHFN
jgi:hypothetical protein